MVRALGATRLARLTRPEIQLWADSLGREGCAPGTIRHIVGSLRALIGWAEPRGYVHLNPCSGLRLPSGGEARDRVATPAEAARLIAALPPRDQAALGLAVYAGLRIGELLALDFSALDLDQHTISVERGWDPTAREFIETKSRRPRTVPISNRLAMLLADHRVLMDHPTDGLLFPGRDPRYPTHPRVLRRHAEATWQRAGPASAGLP